MGIMKFENSIHYTKRRYVAEVVVQLKEKRQNITAKKNPHRPVSESPIAATISMSPGFKRCTDVGGVALREPAPRVSHGNFVVFG